MRFSQHYYSGAIADASVSAAVVLPALVVSASVSVEGGLIMAGDFMVMSPLEMEAEIFSPLDMISVDTTPLDMED